jgi:hypothetical protein
MVMVSTHTFYGLESRVQNPQYTVQDPRVYSSKFTPPQRQTLNPKPLTLNPKP